MYDLLLKGGRVIDPGQGIDGEMDVAISGGKVAAVSPNIPASESARVLDVSGKLVAPGLVDLHAHIYRGATSLGADVDETCLKRGVTTVVDGGSSGTDNFEGFRRWIAAGSRTRVFCFVHISSLGLTAIHRAGELANPDYADPQGVLEILRRHPDLALGVKLRATDREVGGSCLPMLEIGRRVADEAGRPLMVHIGNTVETLPRILERLRPGDIVTHCMTGRRNGLLDDSGAILPEAREARERGVFFDAAHGRSHFSFQVAARLLDQGFLPDTISTDLTAYSTSSVVYDLPTTMTKFVTLGLPLAEVVRLATLRPAQVLGKDGEFGTLRPGVAADVAVLEWEDGEFPLEDAVGERRTARHRLVAHLTIRNGEPV